MKRTIKIFSDGSRLEYDKGKFDLWCIYLTLPDQQRIAPKDVQYFTRFQQLAQIYGHHKIYNDFVLIYKKTTARLDPDVLNFITDIAEQYQTDALRMDKLFTIVYAGMVAEENKKHAILKKRIKRLGMYQILTEQLSPAEAANFSKGKKWREIDKECNARGF